MPQAPQIGDVIGGYRVERLIGRGGMGIVYLAQDVEAGTQAALKLLTPDLVEGPGFKERFQREADYANAIDHPNIIKSFRAGETGGILYMGMEYVDGTDLKAVLQTEGRLDPDRTTAILGQVASALDAAHEGGLLHRDVKPGNIMIASGRGHQEEGHAYLTDFGLSKNPSSDSVALTNAGEFVGTIDYTAPEQVLGKPLDGRADVYALGCVVYECLTGSVPFQKPRDVEVIYAHIQDPPPRLSEARPDLPVELDAVISRAMAKDPAERQATCAELIEEVRTAAGLGGTPAGAGPAQDAPAAQELRLRVTAGRAVGTEIALDDEFEIGRHAPGAGQLGKDIEISRMHARLFLDPLGRRMIEDLGSTNGTFVNGERVTAPLALAAGDTIEVGETTLVVEAVGPAPAQELPPAASGPPPMVTVFSAVPSFALEDDTPPAEPPSGEEPGGDADAGADTQVEPGDQVPSPADVLAGSAAPPSAEAPLAPPPAVTVFANVPSSLEDLAPGPPAPEDPDPPLAPSEAESEGEGESPVAPGLDPAAAVPIALRVAIDPASGAVAVAVEDGFGTVTFRREDGEWRVEPGS